MEADVVVVVVGSVGVGVAVVGGVVGVALVGYDALVDFLFFWGRGFGGVPTWLGIGAEGLW